MAAASWLLAVFQKGNPAGDGFHVMECDGEFFGAEEAGDDLGDAGDGDALLPADLIKDVPWGLEREFVIGGVRDASGDRHDQVVAIDFGLYLRDDRRRISAGSGEAEAGERLDGGVARGA